MKRSIYYSNFKYNPIDPASNKDSLEIDDLYNVSVSNNAIASAISEEEILENFFNETEIVTIKTNNTELLKTIYEYIPYQFYNDVNQIYKTRLFVITNDNKLYELNLTTYTFELLYTFTVKPRIIFSNDLFYIFDSQNKCVTIDNNQVISIENLPNITSFVYDENNIYFSDETLPFHLFINNKCELKDLSSNLNIFSHIKTSIEDGEIYKIVNLKGKIYIITQYSILKYDSDNSMLYKQNNIETEIFRNSIKQIDDYILFYTLDGLYAFDGNDLKKLFANYLHFNKNANFIYFNQNIYVFSDNYPNFIFKYDLTNNYFLPLNFGQISNLYKVKSHSNYNLCVSIIDNNEFKNYSLFNKNISKINQYVKFKPTNFGSTSIKRIKNIHINSEGDFNIEITSNQSQIVLKISDLTTYDNLSLYGNYFTFNITSDSEFKLKSIMIDYEEIGEWNVFFWYKKTTK